MLLSSYTTYNNALWVNKKHTLRGHMKGYSNSKGGKGGYFIDDVGVGDQAHVRILDVNGNDVPISNFPADANGIRRVEAPYEIHIAQYENVNGVPVEPLNVTRYRAKDIKVDGHDFLPPSSEMSWDEVIEQFASSLANPNKANWGGKSSALEAISDGGITFRWYKNGTGTGIEGIPSFFPKRD